MLSGRVYTFLVSVRRGFFEFLSADSATGGRCNPGRTAHRRGFTILWLLLLRNNDYAGSAGISGVLWTRHARECHCIDLVRRRVLPPWRLAWCSHGVRDRRQVRFHLIGIRGSELTTGELEDSDAARLWQLLASAR